MPTRKNNSPKRHSRRANAAESPTTSLNVAERERQRMIAEAAYFAAQHRGFIPGQEVNDWLSAEHQIDRRLGLDQSE